MDTYVDGETPNPECYVNKPRSAVGRALSDYKDSALIFVHAPRTAGSTLSRIMDWEYEPLEICDVDGRFYYWSFQKISRWPKERLAKMRLFKGHMPFGLHRYMPQAARYITLLRDPIDRTASEYYGRRYRRTHPIADRDAKLQSFEEYVKTVPYDNPQTKAIAGVQCVYEYHWYTVIPSYRVYCGPCTAETLEIAKRNLSRYFCLVGLTERFEETLALAKIMFGWKIPYYTAVREGVRRPKRDEISSRQRDVIAKYHEFDMELYRYGVSLFEQAVAKYGDRIAVACSEIREAGKPTAARSRYYKIRSFARRHFIRTHCALQ
jgi:galactose-3-O-sulfotransferase